VSVVGQRAATGRIMLGVAVETARICVPTIVEGAFGRMTWEKGNRRLESWSKHLLDQAAIDLEVRGGEKLGARDAFVVMSNHQSHYDIVVLFQALRRPLRMVAKTELYRIPLVGPAMRAAGFIEVDRSRRERAIASLRHATSVLRSGISVWIAPEGTRSENGVLGPFKKGGFHLAVETAHPILPVTIHGTRAVLVKGTRRVHRGAHVRVDIGEPIDAAGYGHARRKELMRVVREAIAGPLPAELKGGA
jgi:1-acyl-sn-glycerol-3-phosphate acyltransferase